VISNDNTKRLIDAQSKLTRNIERLKTGEKSSSTDSVIQARTDATGVPYVDIGTGLYAAPELIENGGFNYDFTGWEQNSPVGFTINSNSYAGEGAARTILDSSMGAVGADLTTTNAIDLDIGIDYIVGFYVRRVDSDPAYPALNCGITIIHYDENDETVYTENSVSFNEDSYPFWKYVYHHFSPASKSVRIVLWVTTISSGNYEVYIDEASLKRFINRPAMRIISGGMSEGIEFDTPTITSQGTIHGTNFTQEANPYNTPMAGADGKLSADWIPQLPHSGLSGLTTDDPHTQYVKDAGTVTDNAIVRFDTTDGRTIQNSLFLVDDTGNASASGFLLAQSGGSGQTIIGASTQGSIQIGQISSGGTPRTPYIDFYANGTAYNDVRLIASEGSPNSSYGGILGIYASQVNLSPAGNLRYRNVILGDWVAWTPVWTATTTNPVIGNGTLTGRYTRIGNTVHASIYLLFGSTTTAGSGVYYFSLPVAANASYINYWGGSWTATDVTVNNFNGSVRAYGYTTIQLPFTGGSAYVAHQTPMTWGSGDSLRIHWTYEAA